VKLELLHFETESSHWLSHCQVGLSESKQTTVRRSGRVEPLAVDTERMFEKCHWVFIPWTACVLLMKKKDGTWRFCVDYRDKNLTIKDSLIISLIPIIEELVDELCGAKVFCSTR
jgi:hypothetical protein